MGTSLIKKTLDSTYLSKKFSDKLVILFFILLPINAHNKMILVCGGGGVARVISSYCSDIVPNKIK